MRGSFLPPSVFLMRVGTLGVSGLPSWGRRKDPTHCVMLDGELTQRDWTEFNVLPYSESAGMLLFPHVGRLEHGLQLLALTILQ